MPTIFPKAETLKDYKDLLNKYIAEQKANNNKINQTENQITSSKSEIESISLFNFSFKVSLNNLDTLKIISLVFS